MPLSNSDVDVIADRIASQVRILKMVHAISMGGLVVAFVFFIWQGVRVSDVVPLVPLAFLAMGVAMSYVIPPFARRSGLTALRGETEIDAVDLVLPYVSGHIAGIGVLTGTGIVSCVPLGGHMGGAPSWFLATPVALLFLMLLRFPRTAAVTEWIKTAGEEVGGLSVRSADGSDGAD